MCVFYRQGFFLIRNNFFRGFQSFKSVKLFTFFNISIDLKSKFRNRKIHYLKPISPHEKNLYENIECCWTSNDLKNLYLIYIFSFCRNRILKIFICFLRWFCRSVHI